MQPWPATCNLSQSHAAETGKQGQSLENFPLFFLEFLISFHIQIIFMLQSAV